MKTSCRLLSMLCAVMVITLAYTNNLSADDIPGATFLTIPPGARALGMGGAFTGSLNDPSSFFYNPGAIGFYDRFAYVVVNQGLPPGVGRLIEQGLLATAGKILYDETIPPEPAWYPQLNVGMRYVFSSYALPVDRMGNFGLHMTYLSMGETEVYDFQGVLIGTYETHDVAVGLSYGKTYLDRIGVGITGKYIYCYLVPPWVWERVPELGILKGGIGTAWAVDLGALCRVWGCGVGVSVLNLGTRITYAELGSPDRLPMRIRGGISVEPLVVLDSLFGGRNIKVLGKPVYDVVNVTLNYDRAYDPEQPDDTWKYKGYEFTFLDFFSYRRGEWNELGASSGFGVNLRNVKIDVAEFSELNTYQVQLTLHAIEPPEHIKNNKNLHKWLTIASASFAPGGGQFYKGEGVKGSLFFVPGLCLGNSYLTSTSNTTKALSLAGLILLYVGSGLEAILND